MGRVERCGGTGKGTVATKYLDSVAACKALKDHGALVFEAVYYMTVLDYGAYMETRQAINLELYERFEAEGLEF